MIAVMTGLLRDQQDSAARGILLEVGLAAHTPTLLEALGSSATAALLMPSLPLVAPSADDVNP